MHRQTSSAGRREEAFICLIFHGRSDVRKSKGEWKLGAGLSAQRNWLSSRHPVWRGEVERAVEWKKKPSRSRNPHAKHLRERDRCNILAGESE